MEASWAFLLPPLVELILDRLPISDYLRFAAVCLSWRAVQREHRLRRHGPSARQMPWLMLPSEVQSPHSKLFYNPSEQCYYRLPLPIAVQGNFCCGASHGWLMFLDHSNMLLILVNPFSGSDIKLPYPPLSPGRIPQYRGALSSSPTDPSCIVLIWTCTHYFYCRVGDSKWESWTRPLELMACLVPDRFPAIHGGNIYIDRGGSKLVVLEPYPVFVERFLDMLGLPQLTMHSKNFLMESDGDILLVTIARKGMYIEGIDIFRADPSQKVWVRVESLGDRVLFLVHGHSLWLPAVDTGGPGNLIYFTWSTEPFSEPFTDRSTLMLLWGEYDYGSHQVVRSQPSNLREKLFTHDDFRWVLPSLY